MTNHSSKNNAKSEAVKFRKKIKDLNTQAEKDNHFESEKNNLLSHINNALEFRIVFEVLTPDQKNIIFYDVKDHIKDEIKVKIEKLILNSNESPALSFYLIMHYLEPSQRKSLYNLINKEPQFITKNYFKNTNLVSIITPPPHEVPSPSSDSKTLADLKHILYFLTDEQREEVLTDFYNKYPAFQFQQHMNTSSDVDNFFNVLPEKRKKDALETLNKIEKDRIIRMVHNHEDLIKILPNLSDYKAKEIIEELELEKIIDTVESLKLVVKKLDTNTIKSCSEKLLTIVNNPRDIAQFYDLPAEQVKIINRSFFNVLIDQIPLSNNSVNEGLPISRLKIDLARAGDQFFNKEYNADGYKKFVKDCKAALRSAKPYLRDWGHIARKVLLTIFTFGFAPFIAPMLKQNAKNPNYSFWKTEQEVKAGKIEKLLSNNIIKNATQKMGQEDSTIEEPSKANKNKL